MAAKKNRPKKFEFAGFINLDFTDDEKTNIDAWMDAFGEEPVHAVVSLVEANWKVGISWDDYHSTYQVALTCKDQASSYFGYCFTLKHDDVGKAMLVFRWFYDVMLKEDLYALNEKRKTYDW